MHEFTSPERKESGPRDPNDTGREIAGELADLASWLAGGDLSPEQFRKTVVSFEARKLARFGFTLDSAVSEGAMVHFSLRVAISGELCASMDVNSDTGEIVTQHTCA